MRIDVITLFPELVEQVIEYGVVGRAAEQNLLELRCWNPRDYTHDRHRTVDDRPYGGGPGMLMKVQPLQDAIAAVRQQNAAARLVYLSPQGQLLDQRKLERQHQAAGADEHDQKAAEAARDAAAGVHHGHDSPDIDDRLGNGLEARGDPATEER